MEYIRRRYIKGLRYQIQSLRKEIKKGNIEDILYDKAITLGYIQGGYWSTILSEQEYIKIFNVIKKLAK